MRVRVWIAERRPCWWCRREFTATKRAYVFCSSACGYAWRGLEQKRRAA